MDEIGEVSVPFERVLELAAWLGRADTTACPPRDNPCWNQRRLDGYLRDRDPVEDECTECWLRYLFMGD